MLLLLSVALAPALAGEAAYYHPDDVAVKSAVFTGLSEKLVPAYDDLESRIAQVGAALGELERGVALLGDAAPAELVDWSKTTRRTMTGRYLQVRKHMSLLQEDYGRVFMAALERALPAVGASYDLTECTQNIMSRTKCVGVNLNAPLAAKLDADTTLISEIADIQSVPWPELVMESNAWTPVALTGTTRYVSVTQLAGALMPSALDARLITLEENLASLGDALDEGDKDALAKAEAFKAAYLAGLAADGAVLRAAVQASVTRSGLGDVGLCANPALFGGCTGEDASKAVLAQVTTDKKLQKELKKGL